MKNKITWLSHASFRISNDKVIYIDPWQLKKSEPKADLILITHDHFDHLSVPDIDKIRKSDTIIVTTVTGKSKIKGDVRVVRPNDRITIGEIQIHAVHAYNREKPFHLKISDNVGFIVTMNGESIYHTGDTEFIEEMKLLKADILLVPVGGKYTSDVVDALKIVEAIKPKTAIPMHWGTLDDVAGEEAAHEFKKRAKTAVEILKPE